MEQIRIIKEMRENDRKSGRTDEFIRPRYMVWENVPGALSSNKGEDFRCVLEETARVIQEDAVIPRPAGKWSNSGCILLDGGSIAWRVHDAQFWGKTIYVDDRVHVLGTPQRRKRIALVADFGGYTAPEILFERKGLSGHSDESEEKGEDAAETARGRSAESERLDGSRDSRVSVCLNDQGGSRISVENGNASPTLRAESHNHEPILLESNQNHATVQTNGISTALPASMGMGGGYVPMVTEGGQSEVKALSFQERAGKPGGGKGILVQEERIGAMAARNVQSVCYGVDTYNQAMEEETAQPLRSADGGDTKPKVLVEKDDNNIN